MMWQIVNRANPFARELADRHYNRQKIGAEQFVPPGRCLVLYAQSGDGKAVWVTSWPFAEFVKHGWAGAWVCSLFRNEGCGLASDLIRSAVAATISQFGEAPELGMVTFLDQTKVVPIMVRGRETWGRTWSLAGFKHVGFTKGGLMAWQLLPAAMPPPDMPIGAIQGLAL